MDHFRTVGNRFFSTVTKNANTLNHRKDIRANPVCGHQAEKFPYSKWLQVMMRVENMFTRKPSALQENY